MNFNGNFTAIKWNLSVDFKPQKRGIYQVMLPELNKTFL